MQVYSIQWRLSFHRPFSSILLFFYNDHKDKYYSLRSNKYKLFLFSFPYFISKEIVHFFDNLFSFNCSISEMMLLTSSLDFFFNSTQFFRFKASEKNNVSTHISQTSGAVMKIRLKKKSLIMECFNY